MAYLIFFFFGVLFGPPPPPPFFYGQNILEEAVMCMDVVWQFLTKGEKSYSI
jgi:hypothetical protein